MSLFSGVPRLIGLVAHWGLYVGAAPMALNPVAIPTYFANIPPHTLAPLTDSPPIGTGTGLLLRRFDFD